MRPAPRTSGRARSDPTAEPAYAGLKAAILARTGHHYYADKDGLLADRLHRRFRASGAADCAAYAALLADRAAGPAEWTALEAEITIGETFFFRYVEQFAALRDTILPGLIAARALERTLRIWSAGCSTGAEPYSLAILVHDLLGEALPAWRVSILGSDISAEALATARAAEYGRWALRTTPPEERARYFIRLPPSPGARRDGAYALRPEFKALVRFERDNLLRLAQPGPARREAFDLILCRNVLIYFDAETVAAVVRGLGRGLRPDGWLLLGHAEPNPAFANFLDPLSLPGTVAYRPRATPPEAPGGGPGAAPPPGADPVASRPEAAPVEAVPVEAVPVEARPPDPPLPDPAPPREAAVPDGPGAARDRIRALADAGETGAAWRALRTALARDPTDAPLRFYEGLLARTLGRDAEAERALRAALYLDRGFVLAHYHLGLLLLAQGRAAEAGRALDNAAVLAQALPPDAVLPEGDGATAVEIAAGAVAARTRLLRAGPAPGLRQPERGPGIRDPGGAEAGGT